MTDHAPPRLQVRTTPLAVEAIPSLLARLPEGVPVASWVRRGDGLVGYGEAARFVASGTERFSSGDQWWQDVLKQASISDEVQLPGTGAVTFGTMAYSAHSRMSSVLSVPEVILGRRQGQAWITRISAAAGTPAGSAASDAGDAAEQAILSSPLAPPTSPGPITVSSGSLSPTGWGQMVARAVAKIRTNVVEKVVLARSEQVVAAEPIDPRWVLQRLAASYDNTWVYCVDGMIGATPEMLVRLERGLVTSRVLAGTIQRTGDDTRDLALAGSLARSSKDLQEHEYAVRSVAEALAPHTLSMNVPEAPFVLHLPNVMHLATDIAGVARAGRSSLALAAGAQPTAAVCGTPSAPAQQLIDELEQLDRGRYAGAIGWMDGTGDGEWGLALRGGQRNPDDPRQMTIYAGCGIVAGSVVADEIGESMAKLQPMRDALAEGSSSSPES